MRERKEVQEVLHGCSVVSRNKSRDQRGLRERLGEDAYLFGPDERCLGKVERDRWEDVVTWVGGSVAEAALECGLQVPRSTRVLWGRSAQEALATWRKWQARTKK